MFLPLVERAMAIFQRRPDGNEPSGRKYGEKTPGPNALLQRQIPQNGASLLVDLLRVEVADAQVELVGDVRAFPSSQTELLTFWSSLKTFSNTTGLGKFLGRVAPVNQLDSARPPKDSPKALQILETDSGLT